LLPVKVMLVILNAVPWELVSVTLCAALVVPTFWLLKVSEVGERLGSAVPVPERLAVCGLFVALSVTVNVPLRAPVAVGVNVTLIVQLAPAATLAPQLFVWAKSPLLLPVKVMLVILNAVPWELVSVTV
jgi:hypothetical protein